jgi:CheY-like chemotaxis protein/anti-sigma regulatory factor (Ser/Thr protein kinase)
MKALGELTGGIVHEFNNILTPVLGYTQILKGKLKDPLLEGYIELIENSAMDGARIVKRIQEYAKIKKKIKEPVDIDKAVMQCVEITKPRWTSESQIERKFIDVQMELKSGSIVEGVPTEVREVIVNLISNAVDAMPSGGVIKIKSYNDSDEVVIKLIDNGIGMDKEIREKIFEPFFTTKNERGNGLGLSIVLSIINDMGGSIEVESEKGKGTEFTVRIPICTSAVKSNILRIKKLSCRNLKILIIDDQEAVAKTVSEMLITLGHDVIYAVNEKEAVKKFIDNDIECVLCDLAMPESTGIQMSEKLGRLKTGIPFILMTGWLGKLKESNMTYINEIIQKPFSLDEISEVINRVTERPVK